MILIGKLTGCEFVTQNSAVEAAWTKTGRTTRVRDCCSCTARTNCICSHNNSTYLINVKILDLLLAESRGDIFTKTMLDRSLTID